MTDSNRFRRGSALIIVLGMLSFMVVSAVGFSVYMRMSRQPSSYLRRASSSRYLLKSALACALERLDGRYTSVDVIDDLVKSTDADFEEDEDTLYDTDDDGVSATGYMEGVCDDPYPGLGPRLKGYSESDNLSDTEKKEKSADAIKKNGGYFDHRVFTPFGPVDKSKTVSTLTLEGLAYLPPALINDVRVYARRTRTASWRNLAYEAGRYAFAAIDVSDLFDVNRVTPCARTSAADARVGFSTLFLRQGASSWGDIETSAGEQHPFGKIVPQGAIDSFLSMADFNLVAWSKDTGATTLAPFCKYVTAGTGAPQIQQTWIDTDAARNALFITDTWFPAEKVGSNRKEDPFVCDVAARQPFDFAGGGKSPSFQEVVMDRLDKDFFGRGGTEFLNAVGGIAATCLYDYLDADSVPVSYALPTVETAPMVCGLSVEAPGGFKPSVSADANAAVKGQWDSGFTAQDANGDPQPLMNTIEAVPYYLDWGLGDLNVKGLVAFPFKRAARKSYPTSYKARAYARVYFGSKEMNCRLDPGSPLRSPGKPENWTKASPFTDGICAGGGESAETLTFDDNVGDFDVAKVVKPFFVKAIDDASAPRQLVYWKVTKQEYTKNDLAQPDKTTTYYSMDSVFAADKPPVFYNASGQPCDWIDSVKATPEAYSATFKNPVNGIWDPKDHPKQASQDNVAAWKDFGKNDKLNEVLYAPHVAVWVQVKSNDDNEPLDVVPAGYYEDVEVGQRPGDWSDEFIEACGGESRPILDFKLQTEFKYRDDGDGFQKLQGSELPFQWSTIYAADLRYNYAPEDWFAMANVSATDVSAESWYGQVSPLLGNDDRDRDIFMFTSDQEYLQSIGELQFLPWVQNLDEKTQRLTGVFNDNVDYNTSYQLNAGSASACANRFPGAWRTWRPKVNNVSIYDFGLDNFRIVSGANAFRVNPFTQDRRILMTVFANTPFDYFVASTNEECNLCGKDPKTDAMLKESFGSKCEVARMSDRVTVGSTSGETGDEEELSDIEKLAEGFREDMRAKVMSWGGGISDWPRWEDVYDKLGWFDDAGPRQLFGYELSSESQPLHGVDKKFLYSFWRDCFQNRQQLYLIFLRAEPLSVGGGGKEALACNQLGVHAVALVWRDPKPPYNGEENRADATAYAGDKPPHRTRILFFHQFD